MLEIYRSIVAAYFVLALVHGAGSAVSAADPAEFTGPFAPAEALKTFQLPDGFRIEIVAAEPDVLDPIDMSFDADGRLYVVEMRDYPTGPPAPAGRVRLLDDDDGDGRMDRSTVFVDGLRFPTDVMAWKGGILVVSAPDIVYFKDTDGDDKADVRTVLYTGFAEINPQHRANGLTFGLDNWIYAANGYGEIRAANSPDAPTLKSHGSDFRIRPDTSSLELVSGRSQFAMALDDWNNRFINNNANHIRHPVLQWHYLTRNPDLVVPRLLEDISDHGALARVYPISRIEPRFNEFHHAGYTTTACGLCICRGRAFPDAYRGNCFCCEPLHNLIHRDVLTPDGVGFVASRAPEEQKHDFLASRDNWFRPVNLTEGPDGALYVADFYRPVIEHPFGIPVELQKGLDFRAGDDRGRIYRIVHKSAPRTPQPHLSGAGAGELVASLENDNAWWRVTAQRLLFERQPRDAVEPLERAAKNSSSALARVHALYALDGLSALDPTLVESALNDPHPHVREHALRLAESRMQDANSLASAVLACVDDEHDRVRFQLAFSVGELVGSEKSRGRAVRVLARLTARDGHVDRFRTAVLSSSAGAENEVLARLRADEPGFLETPCPGALEFARSLADTVGRRGNEGEIVELLSLIAADAAPQPAPWQRAALSPLISRLHRTGTPLETLATKANASRVLGDWAADATASATSHERPTAERVESIGLLALAPASEIVPRLQELLVPQEPREVQQAAVRAISATAESNAVVALVERWSGCTGPVREEILAALLARPDRVPYLLDALQQGQIRAIELGPARRDQLLRYPDPEISGRAKRLLDVDTPAERQQKIATVTAHVIPAKGDVDEGRKVFLAKCANCHNRRTDSEGILHMSPGKVDVGPGLGKLRTRSKETLLQDILDPNRAVDPRFLNYVVATTDGRIVTGMIFSETPGSITLQNGKDLSVVSRSEIAEIKNTGMSLMPEGYESNLTRAELTDLVAFLRH